LVDHLRKKITRVKSKESKKKIEVILNKADEKFEKLRTQKSKIDSHVTKYLKGERNYGWLKKEGESENGSSESEEYRDLEMCLRQTDTTEVQFDRSSGPMTLQNGGSNDFLQAIMQCLLKIRVLAMYFLDKKYLELTKDKSSYKLMDILHNLFMDVHADLAKVSFLTDHKGNLSELIAYLDEQRKEAKTSFRGSNALM
jgi:hypothetical protein